MKRKKSIVYLNRDQLEPHPDNPRKDLGDLTELRESIRFRTFLMTSASLRPETNRSHLYRSRNIGMQNPVSLSGSGQ